MIRAAEAFSAPSPFGRSLVCEATKELTGEDQHTLLETLASKEIGVPVLSISGGMSFIEFGTSYVGNALANFIVQRMLNELPNDGLVPESSADAREHVKGHVDHVNDYSEYAKTNHFTIFRNQEVALRLVKWLGINHPHEPPSKQTAFT
jgi:hypothetical protein